MKRNILLNKLILAACLLVSSLGLSAQDNMYVYKSGNVIFYEEANAIDSVALEDNKTKLVFYKNQKAIYSNKVANIDSITFTPPVMPMADLLDVVFMEDGTAIDISPMRNTVERKASEKTMTYFNESLGRNVAWFDNAPGDVASSGFYKINFENNTAFRNALADGHSLEVLYMYNDNLPIAKEVKPFSAMQAGGTGFLLSNNPSGSDSKINFIAHVGGSWRYAYGGSVPTKGTYYHVVGVWDKVNTKMHIYINGNLINTGTYSGDFKFAASGSNWFCIGGDATPSPSTSAEAAWRGEVAIARAYSDPLSSADVTKLWNTVKDRMTNAPISINDIMLLSNVTVAAESSYTIIAKGFQNGDKVCMTSTADNSQTFDLDATYKTQGALTVKLPKDFKSGEYKLFAVRGKNTAPLGTATITIGEGDELTKKTKITAHRGYWQSGVPQNSIAGFKAAYGLGVYNAETDFWLTKDNVIVCSHDETISGKNIPNSNYTGDLEDVKLSNNEPLPTFQDYMNVMNSDAYKNSDMKLLIELKPNNNALADAIVDAVEKAGLENKVEYIAFSYPLCQYLTTIVPKGTLVGYNNGDKNPGSFANGINWMNYEKEKIRSNKGWIKEAHDKDIFVAVWTITNSPSDLLEFINLGVDCVSTDYPHIMQPIVDLLFSE